MNVISLACLCIYVFFAQVCCGSTRVRSSLSEAAEASMLTQLFFLGRGARPARRVHTDCIYNRRLNAKSDRYIHITAVTADELQRNKMSCFPLHSTHILILQYFIRTSLQLCHRICILKGEGSQESREKSELEDSLFNSCTS